MPGTPGIMKVLSREILGYERDDDSSNGIVINWGGDKCPLVNVKIGSSKSDFEKSLPYNEHYFNDSD